MFEATHLKGFMSMRGSEERARGGGGSGVLPKILKSGSGNHHVEVCGFSNGRGHKLECDRHDFFALFRSPPRLGH